MLTKNVRLLRRQSVFVGSGSPFSNGLKVINEYIFGMEQGGIDLAPFKYYYLTNV
jgi:polysaccharide deacetylase 2 family uncharacterized protein YibQ